MNAVFRGLVPVCRKEFLHIIRDPGTLFFALLIPMLQLFLFGFAVIVQGVKCESISVTALPIQKASSMRFSTTA